MKSRRFKKSRTAARKSNGSKKRGGMFRRALHEIVGKTPIDKIDKAKQVVDAVVKGLSTQSQSTPVPQGKTRTFSTPPTERMRMTNEAIEAIESIHTKNHDYPDENAYKTPVKGSKGSKGSNGSTLSKVRRHHSKLDETMPYSYAPTANNVRLVTGNLFD
jgi:hypothetical protein